MPKKSKGKSQRKPQNNLPQKQQTQNFENEYEEVILNVKNDINIIDVKSDEKKEEIQQEKPQSIMDQLELEKTKKTVPQKENETVELKKPTDNQPIESVDTSNQNETD